MKIVYNIYVAVRKLWNAIFGKNGDGSEIKLVKANPSGDGEALNKIEINGVVYSIIKGTAGVTSVNGESGDVFVASDGSLANDWDETVEYKAGILLSYQGKMYLCIKDAPAGTLPTNTTYFEEKSVADIIEMIKTGAITVGKANLANNFDSKMVLTDNSGYLYRTTGGALEVGEQNRVKKIVGASVPIINGVHNGNFASVTGWEVSGTGISRSVANNEMTITCTDAEAGVSVKRFLPLIGGHRYLLFATIKSSDKTVINNMMYDGANSYNFEASGITSSYKTFVWLVTPSNSNATGQLQLYRTYQSGENGSVTIKNVMLIDLTQTFGTTVANRLYALEQAQAGTGIAKAKEILVKDYYPYNVTAFTHTKTSGKVNNGFNQWDEQWEAGSYDVSTGLPSSTNNAFRSKNYIQVIPNTVYYMCYLSVSAQTNAYITYYDADKNYIGWSGSSGVANSTFTTPANCYYIELTASGTTYKNDICINLHWDGERDGEYEPYQEWNYPVEDVELKGILSLDAQDNWVADGDEYLPSGVVDENIVETDLADLNWQYYEQSGLDGIFYATVNDKDVANIYSAILGSKLKDVGIMAYGDFASSSVADNSFSMQTSSKYINVKYLTANGDVDAFKTYITGLKLLYKSNTPTITTATSYTELQNDSNWGTEKWIDTRDVPMPVFSTCEYIPDLKAKLETVPESPDEDGDYIMHRENGLNSYGSLSTYLANEGYNKTSVLSDPLTDSAGLTYDIETVTQIGNLVNLTIRAQNLGESEIASGTTLFTLASGLAPSGTIKAYANVDGSVVNCQITNLGTVSVGNAIAVNSVVAIMLTYSVAD